MDKFNVQLMTIYIYVVYNDCGTIYRLLMLIVNPHHTFKLYFMLLILYIYIQTLSKWNKNESLWKNGIFFCFVYDDHKLYWKSINFDVSGVTIITIYLIFSINMCLFICIWKFIHKQMFLIFNTNKECFNSEWKNVITLFCCSSVFVIIVVGFVIIIVVEWNDSNWLSRWLKR